MIGLCAVLLLIGLAAAIFSTINRERPMAAVGSARPEVVASMVTGTVTEANATAPREPLAELGVAPSAADSDATSNQASATTRRDR